MVAALVSVPDRLQDEIENKVKNMDNKQLKIRFCHLILKRLKTDIEIFEQKMIDDEIFLRRIH